MSRSVIWKRVKPGAFGALVRPRVRGDCGRRAGLCRTRIGRQVEVEVAPFPLTRFF
jgi:hypothetical protein